MKPEQQEGEVIRTVKSDRGIELVLKLRGYSNELSTMTIENPFEVQGRKIRGEVSCHPASSTVPEHIYVRISDVAISFSGAVALRKEMNAELPRKISYIYKHDVEYNLDGHKSTLPKWEHEGWVDGMSKSAIEEYLEGEGLDCIEVEEMQVRAYLKNKEETQKLINKAKEAGHKIEISREMVECSDPNEDCSTDIVIKYIDEKGTITTETIHTW